MAITKAVLEQVSNELQGYVYMLVDPGSGVPFYVGKGHGLRHAAHVAEALVPVGEDDAERSEKLRRIRGLLADGREPEVWILRYGLRPNEYTAVEAAAIDLLMSFPVTTRKDGAPRLPLGVPAQLTNARREESRGHGISLLQTLIDDFAAPVLATAEPLLLITLNRWVDLPDGETIAGGRIRCGAGFKPEWLVASARAKAQDTIGEAVSAWWSVDPRRVARKNIEHVAAVHRGVTRALFRIVPGSWETRDTTRVDSRGRSIIKAAFRWEAVTSGPLFDEVVGPHGHRVPARPRGAQNAIYYWPR